MSQTDTSYHPRIFGGWRFIEKREKQLLAVTGKREKQLSQRGLLYLQVGGGMGDRGLKVFIGEKDLSTAL